MFLKYVTSGRSVYYKANPATVNAFRDLWTEFSAMERYQGYDIWVYGGFVSYLMKNPQWVTDDIDLFIGRQRLLDLAELSSLMDTLLTLAEKHKLKVDVKYFVDLDSPNGMVRGDTISTLVLPQKVYVNHKLDTVNIGEEVSFGLIQTQSRYVLTAKELERINRGLIAYDGINLKNYNF